MPYFRTKQCMTCLSGSSCGGQVEECALGWLPMDKLGQTGDQHAPQPAPALPAMPVLLHCLLTISLYTQAVLDESFGLLCALQGRQNALFNPQTSVSIQKRHQYTGNVNSETPWDSQNVFLHLHADRVRPQAMTAITQLWPQQQDNTQSVQRYSGHNVYSVQQSHCRAIWKLLGTPHQWWNLSSSACCGCLCCVSP